MERQTGVTVERLTARWTDRAAPGVDEGQARRVWLSTLLAGCDLLPPAMPPSATLVVRRLADPLPGRIASSRYAVRPEPEWEQAVRSALGDLWRRAPRPFAVANRVGGAVGAVSGGGVAVSDPILNDADAVFFLDTAELTAALAADLAAGTAGARWWWRELLPPGRGGLCTVLSRQPELLPVVMAYLAAAGRARAVVAALSRPEALLLALGMAAAHGLPDWRNGPAGPLTWAPGLAGAHGSATTVRPWAEAVECLVAGLAPEQAVLLGLGLTLAGRPFASSLAPAEVQAALAIWWEEAGATTPAFRLTATGAATATTKAAAERLRRAPLQLVRPGFSEQAAPSAVAPSERSILHQIERPSSVVADVAAEEDWPLPAALPPEGVTTRIGGVLYLINVLRQLGFPEGFPAEIGPWALLEALARAMLPGGDPFAELAGDPLWAALAQLDGREPRTLPRLPHAAPLPPEWADLPALDLAGTLAAKVEPALSAWLARAVPGIERHLQQALQLADPLPHLLLLPGRLHVTATHVELTMDLERISVPVRMAGLDQDPGWQAPFRRVILFHFH